MAFLSNVKLKNGEAILGIAFIVYLVLGLDIPEPAANIIDTVPGKIAMFAGVVYLFMNTHAALACLALLVAFDVVRRASNATGHDALYRFSPSEKKKAEHIASYNHTPYTLEQEMVDKMKIKKVGRSIVSPEYNPVKGDTHGAAPL